MLRRRTISTFSTSSTTPKAVARILSPFRTKVFLHHPHDVGNAEDITTPHSSSSSSSSSSSNNNSNKKYLVASTLEEAQSREPPGHRDSALVRFLHRVIFRACTNPLLNPSSSSSSSSTSSSSSADSELDRQHRFFDPRWIPVKSITRYMSNHEEMLEELYSDETNAKFKGGLREIIGTQLCEFCELDFTTLQKQQSANEDSNQKVWMVRKKPVREDYVKFVFSLNEILLKQMKNEPFCTNMLSSILPLSVFEDMKKYRRRIPPILEVARQNIPEATWRLERAPDLSVWIVSEKAPFGLISKSNQSLVRDANNNHNKNEKSQIFSLGVACATSANFSSSSSSSSQSFNPSSRSTTLIDENMVKTSTLSPETFRHVYFSKKFDSIDRALSAKDLVDFVPTFFVPVDVIVPSLSQFGYTKEHVLHYFKEMREVQIVSLPRNQEQEVKQEEEAKEREGEDFYIRLHGWDGFFSMTTTSRSTNERFSQYAMRLDHQETLSARFLEILQKEQQKNPREQFWMPLRKLLELAGKDAEQALPYQGPEALLFFAQLQHKFAFSPQSGGMIALAGPLSALVLNSSSTPCPIAFNELSRILWKTVKLPVSRLEGGKTANAQNKDEEVIKIINGSQDGDDNSVGRQEQEEKEDESPVSSSSSSSSSSLLSDEEVVLQFSLTKQSLQDVQSCFSSWQAFAIAHSEKFAFDSNTQELISKHALDYSTKKQRGLLKPHPGSAIRNMRRVAKEKNQSHPFLLNPELLAKRLWELLPQRGHVPVSYFVNVTLTNEIFPSSSSSSSTREEKGKELFPEQEENLPLASFIPPRGFPAFCLNYSHILTIFDLKPGQAAVMRAGQPLPLGAMKQDLTEQEVVIILASAVHKFGGRLPADRLYHFLPSRLRGGELRKFPRFCLFLEKHKDTFVLMRKGAALDVLLTRTPTELVAI